MNEKLSFTPPEIAVAEAMFYVHGIYENAAKRRFTNPNTSQLSPEVKLEKESWGECENGSILALSFLQQTFVDEFDKLMLIKGHGDFIEDYGYHVYFLAHNKTSDKWYAGSPANHTAHQKSSPLKTMFASTDLEAVFNGISEKDGGTWPFAAEVLASLKYYQTPEFTRADSGKIEAKVFTFDFDLEMYDPGSINSPMGLLITHPPYEILSFNLSSKFS